MVQELSSNNSFFGSSPLSSLSSEEEIQLETPLKLLRGTSYMGGDYSLTLLVMVYPTEGKVSSAATLCSQGGAIQAETGGLPGHRGHLPPIRIVRCNLDKRESSIT